MSESELARRVGQLQRQAERERIARKEAERLLEEKSLELYSAKVAAETANRMKSEFLANISHELRTPLHAIIGMAEVIRASDAAGGPSHVHYATDIYNSGRQLLAVINDLIDLARVEAGQLTLNEHETDVAEMLHRCIASLAHAGTAISRIELSVEPDLPHLWVDEKRLQQAVAKLLANALKFTPPHGRIVVAAGYAADEVVWIQVQDTGVGIEASDLERILQPFVQVDGGRARTHAGTGLGLALSNRLVELHGGTLRIESTVGAGTTVTLDIPRKRILARAA